MGWGVRRTAELVKFRWKKAKSRRDHAEAKNTQTGDKSYQSTDYRDMVLNIIGGANWQTLHGIQSTVRDAEPTNVEKTDPVLSNEEDTLVLVVDSGSALVEPASTASEGIK